MWHSFGGFIVDNNALPVPAPFWESCTCAPGFSGVLSKERHSQQPRTEGSGCVKAAQHLRATQKPMGDQAGSTGDSLVWARAVSAFSLLGVPRFGWLVHILLLEPKGWHCHPNLGPVCSPITAATPESALRPYRSHIIITWEPFGAAFLHTPSSIPDQHTKASEQMQWLLPRAPSSQQTYGLKTYKSAISAVLESLSWFSESLDWRLWIPFIVTFNATIM